MGQGNFFPIFKSVLVRLILYKKKLFSAIVAAYFWQRKGKASHDGTRSALLTQDLSAHRASDVSQTRVPPPPFGLPRLNTTTTNSTIHSLEPCRAFWSNSGLGRPLTCFQTISSLVGIVGVAVSPGELGAQPCAWTR